MTRAGWEPARDARKRLALYREGAIIDFAARGLIRAVCRDVARASWDRDDDGWYVIPPTFWNAMRKMTGTAYRQWPINVFQTGASHPDLPGRGLSAIEAYGVLFSSSDLDEVFGATNRADDSDGKRIATDSGTSALAAPKPRGYDDEPLLQEMSELVERGHTVAAAAAAVAPTARGGGQEESKAKRLERKYIDRQKG